MDLYGKILIRKGMNPKLAKEKSRKQVRYVWSSQIKLYVYLCRRWRYELGGGGFWDFVKWVDTQVPMNVHTPAGIRLFAYARVFHGETRHIFCQTFRSY